MTEKYKNWWNIENIYTGDQKSVDLSNVLGLEIIGENNSQPPVENSTEETDLANRLLSLSLNNRHTPCCSTNTPSPTQDEVQTHQTLITKSSEDTLHAKLKELNEWKKEQVYIDEKDESQDCISLRGVLKEKLVDSNKIIKARLCARGFEEAQDFRKDSPTCSREGLRLATAMITPNKWNLNSLDVKTAFLQG